ncbi:MAG TPA: hypothetical protein VG077_07715 [Verrucomicrobiae bacterium]|nr:hypothetical protein [Verrucomicrobiae bacterium]
MGSINVVILGLTAILAGRAGAAAEATTESSPWLEIGGTHFTGWTGIQPGPDGSASWNPAGQAMFRYPPGPKGWYWEGFRHENDGTRDWSGFYGLQFEIKVPPGRTLELRAVVAIPPVNERSDYVPESHAVCFVNGAEDWQQVMLPWTAFDYDKSCGTFLHYIQSLQLAGKFTDGQPGGEVWLKPIRLVRAPSFVLEAPVCGKAVSAGGTAIYQVTVGNCTDTRQDVRLEFQKYGWEAMPASVAPVALSLAPGATAQCTVTVHIPEGVPAGGHETQTLLAIGNGGAPAKLKFITACDVPHPFLLHTARGWANVRANVAKYAWAKQAAENYIQTADDWREPEAARPPHNISQGHKYVFQSEEFQKLEQTAIAWQLTRNTNFAEKVALFLRRLADEKTGYPSTFAAVSQGEPQEGENFQKVAIAYDAILDANILTPLDKRAIEHTFRLYMQTIEPTLDVGNIGNWNVALSTAALFCSLDIGDLVSANRYLYGPCGFEDFVTKGIMDDGWWWEGSTSYNFWVASELTQSALALEPWGIDLLHRQFTANFSPRTIITPWGLHPPYGMSFEKWGPNHRNARSVKQLWDAVPITADYRGVTFGMNDGHEEQVGGSRLELAYYAFRDPAYVPLIKLSGQRDLIYGVPDLPEVTTKPYLKSGVAENLGFALLRSQTPNRPPRDQIEAVFKIGTQGGYHGHFDRCSLDAIMRYGRSFWNPERIWWGYDNFMYKFYVQNSVNANMAVVDQKQQEAVPSQQLLFYSGKMMQVSVQQTDARWSDPTYGGMVYGAQDSGGAVSSLAALMKKSRQSFPLVTNREWGELGPFSDRVLQRRLGLVTDDCIVIADYLKAEKPHTFDNLFQMTGFESLTAPGKKFLRHDDQFNSDPRSSAQFITDCNWYQADAPALGRFKMVFKKDEKDWRGGFNGLNEPGVLKLDVRSLWPPHQQIMLAQPPENLGGQQWVHYQVSADGKTLAEGQSGVWILGAVNLDVPVAGAAELTVKISTSGGDKKTLFLANARLVSADGKETPVASASGMENIASPDGPGEDYYGGPIKIDGEPYATAIPAQLENPSQPGVIRISLAGQGAVRFKATLGADYPFGDESDRRQIFDVRSRGTEAQFLTVIEPYDKQLMVKSAVALSPDKLRVELADGRVQEISIHNFAGDGTNIWVSLTETKDGRVLRTETTRPAD